MSQTSHYTEEELNEIESLIRLSTTMCVHDRLGSLGLLREIRRYRDMLVNGGLDPYYGRCERFVRRVDGTICQCALRERHEGECEI
jgi:hypothetical protein